jgi:hypothetical protein
MTPYQALMEDAAAMTRAQLRASSRMSSAKVKKWLGDKQRFVLEIKTHELTITNLKR